MAARRRCAASPVLLALAGLCWRPDAGRTWCPALRAQTLRPSAVNGPSLSRARRLPRHAREEQQEAERSSFGSSPAWVKSLVSGLTQIVNGIMGTESVAVTKRFRACEKIAPAALMEGIRADIEERQYLWSGDIDPELYDEACTFTDPTLSFQGLTTFENNIRNLRPILDSVVPAEQRRCLLHKLERDETTGKVYAYWSMIGDLALPWSPRINLGGRTAYSPGPDGRIVSYDESWDISAGEALAQLVTPGSRPSSEPARHWPGRLEGAPPPPPRTTLSRAPAFVVLPGFGNDAEDYIAPLGQDPAVGLQACLSRRGCEAVVSPVRRIDWLRVFLRGLFDADFLAANGTAPVAFGWYLDLAKEQVEEVVQASGEPAVLVGHSAGGWLARALMQREGTDWIKANVRGLVTLGSPHRPPPEGTRDMTQGCLTNLDKAQPGAFYADLLFYVTVAGDAVEGRKAKGNVPILELIQSPSPESTAFNSYSVVCGTGNTTGDGVVPLVAAHLQGARQLTLDGCLHSINVAGTVKPTDRSYLCEGFVDDWLELVAEELRR